MLSLKEAVEVAQTAMPGFFSYIDDSLRLEGAEMSPDKSLWVVTLSFFDQRHANSELGREFPFRSYRTFKLDANSGELFAVSSRLSEAA